MILMISSYFRTFVYERENPCVGVKMCECVKKEIPLKTKNEPTSKYSIRIY
jgi:hypothetical protein